MSRNEYLTTGEVARMMGTTKNTLFHYDQLGIFSPEARGDNDYRYYTVRQMDVLDAIITLRELGMPLPEIKEYMEHRSPENYATLLTKENAVIEQQILALKQKQKWIQRQQKRIETSLTTNPDIIEEITLPRFYIAAHPISSSDDKTISVKVSELLNSYYESKETTGFTVLYIQMERDLARGAHNLYHEVCLAMQTPPKKMPYRILPASKCLAAYHLGDWDDISLAYDRLRSYMKQHQITSSDGRFYEEELINATMTDKRSEYLTRIIVRI